MKQIFLDTETTGLDSAKDRIIEIGAVAFQDRNEVKGEAANWHHYIDPERSVSAEAVKIHGIKDAMLKGKPKFSQVADELLNFIRGHEVVMHNAEFDVGFLDRHLADCDRGPLIKHVAKITDSLQLARKLYPHSRHSLDALAHRFGLDLAKLRHTHGALIDAKLLATVYFLMTSGQTTLSLQTPIATDYAAGKSKTVFKLHRLSEDTAARKRHDEYLRVMHETTEVKPLAMDDKQTK